MKFIFDVNSDRKNEKGIYVISCGDKLYFGQSDNFMRTYMKVYNKLENNTMGIRFTQYISENPDAEFTMRVAEITEPTIDKVKIWVKTNRSNVTGFNSNKPFVEPEIDICSFLYEIGSKHNSQWGSYESAVRDCKSGRLEVVDGKRFFLPDGWSADDLPLNGRIGRKYESKQKNNVASKEINGKKYDLFGNKLKE